MFVDRTQIERHDKLESVVNSFEIAFGKYAVIPAALCSKNSKMPNDREIELKCRLEWSAKGEKNHVCITGIANQSLLFVSSLPLPNATDEIFLATADGGNHFLDFGIHEGMELIFDAKKGFTDGTVLFRQ